MTHSEIIIRTWCQRKSKRSEKHFTDVISKLKKRHTLSCLITEVKREVGSTDKAFFMNPGSQQVPVFPSEASKIDSVNNDKIHTVLHRQQRGNSI